MCCVFDYDNIVPLLHYLYFVDGCVCLCLCADVLALFVVCNGSHPRACTLLSEILQ